MAELKTVSTVEDGTRLMRWFGRHYPSLTSAEFHKLCRGGQIRLNSSRVRGTEILRSGDAIRVPPTISGYTTGNAKKTESGEKFSLTDLEQLRKCIIHSDDDIVVFL
jgi:23S rRNA pseudouridine955/2504/2580 synthase